MVSDTLPTRQIEITRHSDGLIEKKGRPAKNCRMEREVKPFVQLFAVPLVWSMSMRSSDWTPSIVPGDEDLCRVVSDFGRRGRAWCETDVEATDLETIIHDLLDGQYWNPVRVVSFNTGEGWSRDISANVAEELRRRCCELQAREIPPSLAGFFARHESEHRQLTLRLL
jgi:hypothetical protein